MFRPSRFQARQAFFTTWAKMQSGLALAGIETVIADVIALHPEYRGVLAAPDRYEDRDYLPESGQTNPFLHMSLHLALEEQLSINQPPGIRSAFDRLCVQSRDRHASLHVLLDCLGEAIWRAQRDQTQLDASGYLSCVYQAAGMETPEVGD